MKHEESIEKAQAAAVTYRSSLLPMPALHVILTDCNGAYSGQIDRGEEQELHMMR